MWNHAGPTAVTSSASLNSPGGVISAGEFNNLLASFNFSIDTDWALSWLYFPNDFNAVAELIRFRFQAGGGVLYCSAIARDSEYNEVSIFDAAPVAYTTGATIPLIVSIVAGTLYLHTGETLIASGAIPHAIPVVTGYVHFGNTTPGSITTLSAINFQAGADVTPPVISGTSLGEITDITVEFNATVSEVVDLHAYVSANATEDEATILANADLIVLDYGDDESSGVIEGLTPSSTGLYVHLLATDGADLTTTAHIGPFDTLEPQLRITSVSAVSGVPGQQITISHVNADASGKTVSIPSGAVTIVSQDANTTVIEIPEPRTHGNRSTLFSQGVTFTLVSGAQSKTFPLIINPPVGYDFAQIAVLMANGTYLGATDVTPGDYALGHYTAGSGAVNLAIASVDLSEGNIYEYWLYDTSDAAWFPTSGTVFQNAIFFNLDTSTLYELSESVQLQAAVTGALVGSTLTAVGAELSNDNGVTWGTTVTFVDGATLIRGTFLSPDVYDETWEYSVSINGIADIVTLSTRPASVPAITQQPQSTQQVTTGSTVNVSLTATNWVAVQWLVNGVAQAGATSIPLTLNPTSPGVITAQARLTSAEGGITLSNLVTINVAPAYRRLRSEPMASFATPNSPMVGATIAARVRALDGSIVVDVTSYVVNSAGRIEVITNEVPLTDTTAFLECMTPDNSGNYIGYLVDVENL